MDEDIKFRVKRDFGDGLLRQEQLMDRIFARSFQFHD